MSFLPQDPAMLLSYVNTKLRDRYSSFRDFCEEEDVEEQKILNALQAAGYVYDTAKNAFVPADA